MRLDRVHIPRVQAGGGQRGPDDALLGRAVRGGQAVGRAVRVDGGAAYHRKNVSMSGPRRGETLDQQHAGALAPRGAVGARGERLDPPVGGEAALAAEVEERVRRRHHGDAADQGHRALAGAQRLDREVQRDKRRRAGGVDRNGRALQPEHVRDAAGDDAARGAGAEVALEVGRDVVAPARVVLPVGAGEDADPLAAQGERVQATAFQGLPGRLQEQPLLRIHGESLARRDAEQPRVEIGGTVEKTTFAGVRRAGVIRVRVEQPLQVPAPVGRETADRVGTGGHQVPQRLRGVRATGEAHAHPDDDDRVVVGRGDRGDGFAGQGAGEFAVHERGEPLDAGVVEGERRRE